MGMVLDDLDRGIVRLLQENDRHSLAELGKALGVAQSTVNDRIKKLVRDGVISGFHARLSPAAVDLDLLAFVFVGWTDPDVEPRFLATVRQSAKVMECHHVTGGWNYLLKVRARSTSDLEDLLSSLKLAGGIQRSETMIALSTKKETLALDV